MKSKRPHFPILPAIFPGFALAMVSAMTIGIAMVAPIYPAHAATSQTPTAVVELYTSQGCSSCPPADQTLQDISHQKNDLLLLSFHVDYWNYLGWKDPFSDARYTERQRHYAAFLRAPYVYTPQIIVNGKDVVRATAKTRIIQTAEDEPAMPDWMSIETDHTKGQMPGGMLRFHATDASKPSHPLRIWLIGFDKFHENKVASGENAGRRLAHINVVRELDDLGTWNGETRMIPIRLGMKCDGGIAVLLQEPNGGPIRSATMIRF